MLEMALSIIVVSLPGLKPLLRGSRASKRSSHDTMETEHYIEEHKATEV